MPFIAAQDETSWVLRLEGDCGMNCAAGLKGLLLEGLASGRPVCVDFDEAAAIDISILQLFWAAEREAIRTGSGFSSRASDPVRILAREAGFERFPGEPLPESGLTTVE
ncbi:MAG TPA: STAS domain-containing protein [Bryobacteraceae bacterium]|nr:STAS domain-containing protein [Bryobacteraceae bacterium]